MLPDELLLNIVELADDKEKFQLAKSCLLLNLLIKPFRSKILLRKNILAEPFIPEKELKRIEKEEKEKYPRRYMEFVYWKNLKIGFIFRDEQEKWQGYVSLIGTYWEKFSNYDALEIFIYKWLNFYESGCDKKTKKLIDDLQSFDTFIGGRFGLEKTVGFDHHHMYDIYYTCKEKVIYEVIVMYECAMLMDPKKF